MLPELPPPQSTVVVEGTELAPLMYAGQRVVTFRQIDQVHQRPEGTAKRNFRVNRHRLIEGEDYWELSRDEIRSDIGIANAFSPKAPSGVVLTQSGYLMLAKSLTDDLAWRVQRALVDRYFVTVDEVRRPSTDLDLVDAALSVAADPTLALQAMQRLGNALSVARAQLAEVAPDVEFARKVQGSAGSLTISDAAKACGDIGPRKMFEWLREHGYLMKGNMPYQWCINQGLFEVRISVSNAERKTFSYAQPLITGKGLLRVQRQMGCGESMPFELDANPGEVA